MAEIDIKKLKPNPNNPRIIKDEKFKKLVQSLKELPEMAKVRPIVVNQDMIVLGGNMRLKAMQEAGWKKAPVEVVDWDEEKQRQFIIKDNVGYGEWDWELLTNSWDAEQLEEWGLEVPDLETEELEAEEDNYQVPDKIETDIQLGDLFQIGEHRLMCGDSTDSDQVKRLMDGEKADLVFTDPPYGVDYKSKKLGGIMNDKLKDDSLYQFIFDSFSGLQEITKDSAAFYCWYEDRYRYIFQSALENAGLEYKSNLIWNKGMNLSGSDYQKSHENCLYLQKAKQKAQWYGERDKKTILGLRRREITEFKKEQLIKMFMNMQDSSTVWDIDRDNVLTYSHPTQKPVTLAGRAILNNTIGKVIVVDIFSGSGSTMVAAHQLNRKCYGMELDPKYCQVIVDRMLKLDPTLTVKRNGLPYEINNEITANA